MNSFDLVVVHISFRSFWDLIQYFCVRMFSMEHFCNVSIIISNAVDEKKMIGPLVNNLIMIVKLNIQHILYRII